MNYVEYLRGLRALRVIAILLGIIFLLAVALRIWAMQAGTPGKWADQMEHSPTAHVTRQALPGGGERVVVDDPSRKTHAIIEHHGDYIRIDATQPSSFGSAHSHTEFSMGSANRNETVKNGMNHTVLEYRSEQHFTLPIGALFLVSILFGLVSSTMLAGPLSRENEGHLELAWTKPASRERYALGAMATDVAAIVVSQLFAVAVMLICILMFSVPHLTLTNVGPFIGVALLGPIAWYAMLTALSSSLKRGLGMVIGLGWVISIIVTNVATLTAGGDDGLVSNVHAFFSGIAYLIPLSYFQQNGSPTHGIAVGSTTTAIAALAALAVGYLAASILQWRRVEA